MTRTLLAVLIGAALGAGGLSLAGHDAPGAGQGKVTTLSERDVVETLNGKEARVTMLEVAYEPGQGSPPHRHAGPIFGYVLEGEFTLALGDQKETTLKAGETFYEPGGILHRVSRNASPKGRTRVLAVMLHPREAKALTVPADAARH